MVAYANYYQSVIDRITYSSWWRKCCCSIYLHIILKVDKKKSKRAQLIVIIGLLAISFWIQNYYLLGTTLVLGTMFLLFPGFGDVFIKYWFKIGGVMGKINGTILLSIIYFLILLPTSMLKRLFSKPGIALRSPERTNFKDRKHTFQSKDLKYGW